MGSGFTTPDYRQTALNKYEDKTIMNMNTAEQTQETLPQAIERLGLSITSEFIPFSQSRNKGEKSPSLNWRVTIQMGYNAIPGKLSERKFRDILTTDYMAGSGHCPSYSQSFNSRTTNNIQRDKAIWRECEDGFARRESTDFGFVKTRNAILPNTADVISSLIMDADVLEHSSFESWASDLGYDVDSRKAEKIYRDCLEIALKLRNGLDESVLTELRNAVQDY